MEGCARENNAWYHAGVYYYNNNFIIILVNEYREGGICNINFYRWEGGERQREGGRENSRERERGEREVHIILSIFIVLSQWSDMGSLAMVFHFLLVPPLILGGTSCHYQLTKFFGNLMLLPRCEIRHLIRWKLQLKFHTALDMVAV